MLSGVVEWSFGHPKIDGNVNMMLDDYLCFLHGGWRFFCVGYLGGHLWCEWFWRASLSYPAEICAQRPRKHWQSLSGGRGSLRARQGGFGMFHFGRETWNRLMVELQPPLRIWFGQVGACSGLPGKNMYCNPWLSMEFHES